MNAPDRRDRPAEGKGSAMQPDWRDNPVTTDTAATLAGVDAFAQGFLAYETRAGDILAAADADPDCALANAYAAMLWLFLESPEGVARARPYLARAEAAAPQAGERERLTVAAARAWADGDATRAVALGEAASEQFPRDLVLAKVTQYHHFNRGDAPGMLRIAARVLPANRDLAYAHGLVAFGYEQCHMLAEAEHAARTAIGLQRREPWAHHALAHVLLTQGRNDEGRAFLEDVKDTWTGLNSFMLTHNWWHLSLVMIEQGEAARARPLRDPYLGHLEGILAGPDRGGVAAGAAGTGGRGRGRPLAGRGRPSGAADRRACAAVPRSALSVWPCPRRPPGGGGDAGEPAPLRRDRAGRRPPRLAGGGAAGGGGLGRACAGRP
jgi:hypothetical protein